MTGAKHIGNNIFVGFTDVAGFRFFSGPVDGDPIVAIRVAEAVVAEFREESAVGFEREKDLCCHAE